MKSKKGLDAVEMMRKIRDKLSKELANMSYEEQKRYIREKVKLKLKTNRGKRKDVHAA